MIKSFLLEVCAYNLQSAVIAAQAGAGRIELCDNYYEGGTTPSYGVIQKVRQALSIPVYPIVRPRGGNFLYSDEEIDIIKRDIEVCKELGCEGISTGVQLPDGNIDTERMKQLADCAYPMKITCHRVFDTTPDPFTALEQLIDCGCERVLTSGQQQVAATGSNLLAALVQAAGNRIIIMPGSGVRASNIETLIAATGAIEYHTSGKITSRSQYDVNSQIVSMGQLCMADGNEIGAIIAIGRKATK